MNSINGCSRATGVIPRANQEELDRKELQLNNLLHNIGLVLGGGFYFSPSNRIWICRSRGVKKLPNEW